MVDRVAPKYELDLTMAGRWLEGAGWRARADGARRNADGEPLDVPILTPSGADLTDMLIVAEGWKRAGVAAETVAVPAARQNDGELLVGFRAAYYASPV